MDGMTGPLFLKALDKINKIADLKSTTVELPLMKKEVTITPLDGKEELYLKTMSTSMDNFLNELNKIIYDHLAYTDGSPKEPYEEFLKKLFMPDKSIIIWALIVSTYNSIETFEFNCPQCKNKDDLYIEPIELAGEDSFPKTWDLEFAPEEYVEDKSFMDGQLQFKIGIVSELERIMIFKHIEIIQAKDNIEKQNSVIDDADTLIYMIKEVTIGKGKGKVILENQISDIYPFIKSLPIKVRDEIKDEINTKIFDDYLPKFYKNHVCSKCGHNQKIDFDMELEFFRKALSIS